MWLKLQRHWLTIVILLVALGVRLWRWPNNPPTLYWEEVALGYDAWSIAQTGRDYHGEAWPMVAFTSFGDYKPSGYFYATAFLMRIFGPHDWVIRLPSLLAGLFIVWACGALVRRVGDRPFGRGWRVSHLAMLIAALNPALLHVSRVGFESNLATAFFLGGVLLLWPAVSSLRSRRLFATTVGGAGCLWLAFYTYHALRVVAPALGVFLFFWRARQIAPEKKIFSRGWWRARPDWLSTVSATFFVSLLFALPFVHNLFSVTVTQRFAETSLFSNLSLIEASNQCRKLAGDTFIARFYCHRFFFFGRQIVQNFFAHFNFSYLFFSGDVNRRHSVGLFGVFFPWEIMAFAGASFCLLQRGRQRLPEKFFLLFWLIVGLLPASLTVAVPHLLRSLNVVPLLVVAVSYGWWYLSRLCAAKWRFWLKRLIFLLYIGTSLVWQFYYHAYYRVAFSDVWQDGYQPALTALSQLMAQFPDESVYMTRHLGRPSIYYFWYQRIAPEKVQKAADTSLFDQGEFLTFERINFGTGLANGQQLLLVTPEEWVSLPATEATSEIKNLQGETVLVVGRQNYVSANKNQHENN